MVKTRSGKRTDSNFINDATSGASSAEKRTNDDHPSKSSKTTETKNRPSTKEYRYPSCKRHPRGGVKCATCFRANKTEAELSKIMQKCQEKRMPYPRKSTGGKAPRKRLRIEGG